MKIGKRGWFLFSAWFILIMLLIMASLPGPGPAAAAAAPLFQVTETPSPTPVIAYNYELSSGNIIEIERSVNYGQIGIITALGLVAGLLFLKGIFNLVVHYLY